MKSFLKNVLSTIVGIVLSVVVVVLLFIGIISIAVSSLDSDNEAKVGENSILKINLSKPIVERSSGNPFENISITNLEPEEETEFKTKYDRVFNAFDKRMAGVIRKE